MPRTSPRHRVPARERRSVSVPILGQRSENGAGGCKLASARSARSTSATERASILMWSSVGASSIGASGMIPFIDSKPWSA